MGLKNEGLNSQENKQRQLSKFQRNKIFLSVSRYVAKSSRLINAPPWVFLMFFKLYKWYQIAQRITYFN